MERESFRPPEDELVEAFRLDGDLFELDQDRCRTWESPLKQLICISQTSDGRALLGRLDTISPLINSLEQFHRSFSKFQLQCPEGSHVVFPEFPCLLLLFLKLIRNLCAGDASSQVTFLNRDGSHLLVSIATALISVCEPAHELKTSDDLKGVRTASRPEEADQSAAYSGPKGSDIHIRTRYILKQSSGSSPTSVCSSISGGELYAVDIPVAAAFNCLRMLLQLLGNFSRGGDACQAAVWQAFFPALFLELASLNNRDLNDPLCMTLYTCCKNNKERVWYLSQDHGIALMSLLLVSTADNDPELLNGGRIYWFEMLVREVCIEQSLLPLLFTSLGITPLRQKLELSEFYTHLFFSACQLRLKTCSFTSMHASLLYMLLHCLTYDIEKASKTNDSGEASLKLMSKESLCFTVDILRRAAECVGEELTVNFAAPPSLHLSSHPVQILGCLLSFWRVLFTCDPNSEHRAVLTQVLLSNGLLDLLLQMLEALGLPEAPGRSSHAQNLGRDRTLTEAGTLPATTCYQGYRRDIVAVIGNASHQNRLVQDQVREKGKLFVVLQQSTVEANNPFLREWGLWAMRNLLEGNTSNQQEIASLEMKEAINLAELNDMGLNLEINPNTRRPSLVNIGH